MAYHPTHETQWTPGLREMGNYWRTVCTFLEERFDTKEQATAWADRCLDPVARQYFRAGAVPVPNLRAPA